LEKNRISFKNFLLNDIDEIKKEILEQWNILVNAKPEDILLIEREPLTKTQKDHSENIIRMIRTQTNEWNAIQWLRCKKFTGIIQEEISKGDKSNSNLLLCYGHKK